MTSERCPLALQRLVDAKEPLVNAYIGRWTVRLTRRRWEEQEESMRAP